MRLGYARPLVLSAAAACGLVVLGGASASAAKPVRSGVRAVALGASTPSPARGSWGAGVEAVLPANAAENGFVQLDSVSCASAGNCTAVGSYDDNSGGRQGLVLTETAGRWGAGVGAALPANAATGTNQFVSLNSVSCASPGNCSAVGAYRDGSGSSQGLLLTKTAGSWTTGVEAVLPGNAKGVFSLDSVSCASAANCSAVGTYVNESSSSNAGLEIDGLLLTETGGTWAPAIEATLPANAATGTHQEVFINSVSCASAGNCSAVGGYADSSGGGPGLLLNETAGRWATGVEAVLPANASSPSVSFGVSSVSCASAGNCSAVGSYGNSGGGQGLLLPERRGRWGTGRRAVLPANACPIGPGAGQCDDGPGAEITSVSCASAGNCSAFGAYTATNDTGLLLSETAGRWRAGVEAPSGASPISSTSISCASAGNCSAVGENGPLLTETAGKWVVVGVALPANAGENPYFQLDSVSCASPGNCSAVGLYTDGSGNYHGLLLNSHPQRPCVVPKLKGETLATARRSIETHACSIGEIKHAASQTIKEGHVISQEPKPGRRLRHGARVNVVVSKGGRR